MVSQSNAAARAVANAAATASTAALESAAAATATAAAKPLSPARLAANRANAQKSTGPRTPEGKRRSSANSFLHGGFARDTLLPSESPTAFASRRRAFLEALNPQTCPELICADRAFNLTWRLQRLQDADTALHLAAAATLDATMDKARARLRDREHELTDEERALVDAPNPDCPPGMSLADAFDGADAKDNPFDRLSSTEARLQGMFHRTLKELRQLQKDRRDAAERADDPPCPFLAPEDEEYDPDADEHNETEEDDDEDAVTPAQQMTRNEPTAPPGTCPPEVACVVATAPQPAPARTTPREKDETDPTPLATT